MRVPGDKSISVRSLILGALTVGQTRIEGMLEGEDAMSTANAMRALAEHHKPWVKASALVGLTPLMRMVYRSIVALTRRDIHVCDTRDEAIAYLVGRRTTHAPGKLG